MSNLTEASIVEFRAGLNTILNHSSTKHLCSSEIFIELDKLLGERKTAKTFDDLSRIAHDEVQKSAKERVLSNEPDWEYLAVMDGDFKTANAITKASKRITKAIDRLTKAIEDADKI